MHSIATIHITQSGLFQFGALLFSTLEILVVVFLLIEFHIQNQIRYLYYSKVICNTVYQPFHLLGLCLVRFGFMIIFPMTNIPIPGRSTSIYLHSDIWYICIMALMSMTGGLLSSKAMAGAGTIAPHHLQDSTGSLV